MALDLKAAANWLVAHDRVDGRRLALIGHCLGGRTTFVGLVSYPENWTCGCGWYGGGAFHGLGEVPPPAARLAALEQPALNRNRNDPD